MLWELHAQVITIKTGDGYERPPHQMHRWSTASATLVWPSSLLTVALRRPFTPQIAGIDYGGSRIHRLTVQELGTYIITLGSYIGTYFALAIEYSSQRRGFS